MILEVSRRLRLVSVVDKVTAIGAGGLGFDCPAASVSSGLPPLLVLRSSIPQALSHVEGPPLVTQCGGDATTHEYNEDLILFFYLIFCNLESWQLL